MRADESGFDGASDSRGASGSVIGIGIEIERSANRSR